MAKKQVTTKPTNQRGQIKPAPSGRNWTVEKRGEDIFYKRLDGHYVKMPPPGETSTIIRGGSIFPTPKPSKAEP